MKERMRVSNRSVGLISSFQETFWWKFSRI